MSLHKSTWLIVLVFISFKTIAQNTHLFSVKDCVDYALKNNIQVKNALLDIEIQQQSNRVTTAQALPSLNGSANYTDNIIVPTTLVPGDFFGQPGKYVAVKFGLQYNAAAGITLQQTLFDGQVFVGLQARRTSIDYR
ncbi:MAG: TolC family protein, partial [Parafilimonas sp.]|nr:TolC family protein [Parafilimonas sp.]